MKVQEERGKSENERQTEWKRYQDRQRHINCGGRERKGEHERRSTTKEEKGRGRERKGKERRVKEGRGRAKKGQEWRGRERTEAGGRGRERRRMEK